MTASFQALHGPGIEVAGDEAMRALGSQLAAEAGPGSTFALVGDLGSGKTTFVQGVATALGVTRAVTSPTFNLFLSYPGTSGNLLHLDAYRLRPGSSLETICPEESFTGSWIFCVEWPEHVAADLDPEAIWLSFTIEEPGQRHRVRLA